MKNNQKGNALILVLITAYLAIAIGCYVYQSKTSDSEQLSVSDMKMYSDGTLSFEYPFILTAQKERDKVTLRHSINYNHANVCDFKGDAPPLEQIHDFGVTFKVVPMSPKAYIESTGWPDWEYVSANPFSIGSYGGYFISPGVEGCGQHIYYLVIAPNRTLVVDRPFVSEFLQGKAYSQLILNRPGIINPEQEREFFKNIMLSVKVSGSEEVRSGTVQNVTKGSNGYSIKFPTGGETFYAGDTITLRWEAPDVKNVTMALSPHGCDKTMHCGIFPGNGFYQSFSVPATGEYTYTIPKDTPTYSGYTIVITDSTGVYEGVGVETGPFTIIAK